MKHDLVSCIIWPAARAGLAKASPHLSGSEASIGTNACYIFDLRPLTGRDSRRGGMADAVDSKSSVFYSD